MFHLATMSAAARIPTTRGGGKYSPLQIREKEEEGRVRLDLHACKSSHMAFRHLIPGSLPTRRDRMAAGAGFILMVYALIAIAVTLGYSALWPIYELDFASCGSKATTTGNISSNISSSNISSISSNISSSNISSISSNISSISSNISIDGGIGSNNSQGLAASNLTSAALMRTGDDGAESQLDPDVIFQYQIYRGAALASLVWGLALMYVAGYYLVRAFVTFCKCCHANHRFWAFLLGILAIGSLAVYVMVWPEDSAAHPCLTRGMDLQFAKLMIYVAFGFLLAVPFCVQPFSLRRSPAEIQLLRAALQLCGASTYSSTANSTSTNTTTTTTTTEAEAAAEKLGYQSV